MNPTIDITTAEQDRITNTVLGAHPHQSLYPTLTRIKASEGGRAKPWVIKEIEPSGRNLNAADIGENNGR